MLYACKIAKLDTHRMFPFILECSCVCFVFWIVFEDLVIVIKLFTKQMLTQNRILMKIKSKDRERNSSSLWWTLYSLLLNIFSFFFVIFTLFFRYIFYVQLITILNSKEQKCEKYHKPVLIAKLFYVLVTPQSSVK